MESLWLPIAHINAILLCIKKSMVLWSWHPEYLFSETSVLIMGFINSYFTFPISLNIHLIHNETPPTRKKGSSPPLPCPLHCLTPWCLGQSLCRRETRICFSHIKENTEKSGLIKRKKKSISKNLNRYPVTQWWIKRDHHSLFSVKTVSQVQQAFQTVSWQPRLFCSKTGQQ